MRLSELLKLDDFKNAGIEIIGNLRTTEREYFVLGRSGQSAFPITRNTHLVDVTGENRDPEISYEEELSIRRRLGIRIPPFHTLHK
jgi:hypothetical protein